MQFALLRERWGQFEVSYQLHTFKYITYGKSTTGGRASSPP
jgi:hypothetical protein